MRVLLQRSRQAQVKIGETVVGEIDHGYILLVGIEDADTDKDVAYLVRKITNLRVFEDAGGKMNLSIQEVSGSILSVSQFTLYADTRKGNRPSFTAAGQPAFAKEMYQKFNEQLRATGLTVATGEFGADMQVSLVNDGPVTIWFDTNQIRWVINLFF